MQEIYNHIINIKGFYELCIHYFLKLQPRMYLIDMICAVYISISFVKSSRHCECGYQYFINVILIS